MAVLSSARIASVLAPFLRSAVPQPPPALFDQLGLYLDLLLKWNARTNLTAVRDPEVIVTRHFGESLFLAAHLPANARTVLDLGSGAGFPGLPLHLLRPDLSVTLAESQRKKSSFLHEAVRSLSLSTRIYPGRAEDLVDSTHFDVITLRAVDNMPLALRLAARLGSICMILSTRRELPPETPDISLPVPQSEDRVLLIRSSTILSAVPRGT